MTLTGYSLPPTDLVTAGMLADAMTRGRIREVRVVDPRGRTALALDARPANDETTVEVRAGRLATFGAAWNTKPTQSLTVAQLTSILDGAQAVVVRVESTTEPFTVIATAPGSSRWGRGNGSWLQLVPADPPPVESSPAS